MYNEGMSAATKLEILQLKMEKVEAVINLIIERQRIKKFEAALEHIGNGVYYPYASPAFAAKAALRGEFPRDA